MWSKIVRRIVVFHETNNVTFIRRLLQLKHGEKNLGYQSVHYSNTSGYLVDPQPFRKNVLSNS